MTKAKATNTNHCSVKGWCIAMGMALDGDRDSSRAGFQMAFTFNLNGKDSRRMLVYRSRARDSKAIVLNVCPWCRAELEPICNPPTKKRTKKVKTSAG